MEPLFLGNRDRALLGVWSQPSGPVDRNHGVVLCPPIGQEHVRTHWALRQLATALSRAGFHCLRFDWFGVGDSAGDLSEATLLHWREDLTRAAQKLRDSAGLQQISLVGLRIGASLAALGAAEVRPATIVLWDPVVDGRGYVAALRALTRQLFSDPNRYWKIDSARHQPGATEIVGCDFGPRLVAEIEQLDLGDGAMMPQVPLCLVRSTDEHDLEVFGQRLCASRRAVELFDTASRARWTHADDVERLLLPGDVIRVITEFLEAKAQ